MYLERRPTEATPAPEEGFAHRNDEHPIHRLRGPFCANISFLMVAEQLGADPGALT
ncbi:hypothetical protein BJV82DRAFT_670678 [Fennellomyces sp. T-0311]|nr:hypothetical protein BJV82DRAFT_670678 [Fennellomyces sp. T-0311]